MRKSKIDYGWWENSIYPVDRTQNDILHFPPAKITKVSLKKFREIEREIVHATDIMLENNSLAAGGKIDKDTRAHVECYLNVIEIHSENRSACVGYNCWY